jgi:hypothetical protein
MRWAGHVAHMGEERNVYKGLMGEPEGKRPLERSRRRWEDGIRMDLREIGLGSVDLIHLAQDGNWWQAVVNSDEPDARQTFLTLPLEYYFCYVILVAKDTWMLRKVGQVDSSQNFYIVVAFSTQLMLLIFSNGNNYLLPTIIL